MKDEGNDETAAPWDLKVRTKRFALGVIRMFSELPKVTEAQVLGKQVLRSATSVGANYREAQRGRSKAEFISKMGDCLKELDETAYWFELLLESGVGPQRSITPLMEECLELIAIFTAAVKRAKGRVDKG